MVGFQLGLIVIINVVIRFITLMNIHAVVIILQKEIVLICGYTLEILQILLPILVLAARCLERSVLQLILVQLSINAVLVTLIMILKQLLLVIVQIIALQGHFIIVNVIN